MNLDQKIDEIRSFIFEEMAFKGFLAFVSAVSGYILISSYAPLIGVTVGTVGFTVGLNNCEITAGIRSYKAII